jgi:predicted RNase H-like HicB family nuclease
LWRTIGIEVSGDKQVKKTLQLTAIIEREDDTYVATCPEVGVVSQGDTIEAARYNLLEAVEGFFEAASPSEIKRRSKKETYIMPLMSAAPNLKTRRVSGIE